MVIISIIAVILLTILIVWAIDNFIPKKFKTPILISLWAIIIFLGYITFMSANFNRMKQLFICGIWGLHIKSLNNILNYVYTWIQF